MADSDDILLRQRKKFQEHREWIQRQQEEFKTLNVDMGAGATDFGVGADAADTTNSTTTDYHSNQSSNRQRHPDGSPAVMVPPPHSAHHHHTHHHNLPQYPPSLQRHDDPHLHHHHHAHHRVASTPSMNRMPSGDEMNIPPQYYAPQAYAPPTLNNAISQTPNDRSQPSFATQNNSNHTNSESYHHQQDQQYHHPHASHFPFEQNSNGQMQVYTGPNGEVMMVRMDENENPMLMYHNSPLNVYHRSKVWKQRRQQSLEQKRREHMLDEGDECTFTPHIHDELYDDPRNREILPNCSGFEEFLQRQHAAREKRAAAERAKNRCDGSNWRNQLTKPQGPSFENRPRRGEIRALQQPLSAPTQHVPSALGKVDPFYEPFLNSDDVEFSHRRHPPVLPQGLFSVRGSSAIMDAKLKQHTSIGSILQ